MDKRFGNRKYRRLVQEGLRFVHVAELSILPDIREVSSSRRMAKEPRFRFDPKLSPRFLRK